MAGFDGFLSPINARMERIEVTIPFDYWYNACGAYLDPYTACFLRNNQLRLCDKESTTSQFATPRSWSYLSKHLQAAVEEYHNNKDKIKFLKNAYMYAVGYLGKETADLYKQSLAQQLEYDFEGMVRNNRYNVEIESVFSQIAFGNVVRYFNTKKEINEFIEFIRDMMNRYKGIDTISNVILSVMYEILSLSNMYRNVKTDDGKKKYELYSYALDQMFSKGDPDPSSHRIHSIVDRIMNNKVDFN